MGLTKKSSIVFASEILQDAVSGAFEGIKALDGTAAVANMGGLVAERGGETVKVPYFGNLGELEFITDENDALSVTELTETSEEATVVHGGKAFAISGFAQISADPNSDPYAEAGKQMKEIVLRGADKKLIDAASATLAPMTLDVYSASVPRKIDYDLVVDGKMLWGDEQSDIVLMIVHSKTFGDMQKIKTADGAPLLVMPTEGDIARFCGIPVKVSDRLAPNTDTPAKYTTLLLKRNALAFWYASQPTVDEDKDILNNSKVAATHVYFVAYRYNRLPNLTKGGVVILKHN